MSRARTTLRKRASSTVENQRLPNHMPPEHGNHEDEGKDDGIKADEPLLPVKERGPDVREQEKGDERSAPNGGPERAGQEKEDDRRAAVGGSAVDDPGEESDARGLGRRGRVLRPQSAVEHGSEDKDHGIDDQAHGVHGYGYQAIDSEGSAEGHAERKPAEGFPVDLLVDEGQVPDAGQHFQNRMTGATCAGGKNSVRSTIMIMEKPNPVAPRTIPARKTAVKT